MKGDKEREKKRQRISGQRNSYEKYFLVERRKLALKVNECKQEYVALLESMRRRFLRL